MRCGLLFLLIAVAVQAGCSSTRHVNAEVYPNWQRASLNADLEGREGLVRLRDGRLIVGREIEVGPDSVSWFKAHTWQRAETSEVVRVTRLRRGKGALQGAGIGILAGAVLSATALSLHAKGVEDNFFGPGFWMPVGAVLGGVPGGLAGALIGALRGERRHYLLQWERQGSSDH